MNILAFAMILTGPLIYFVGWLGLASGGTLLLFGYDKWQARRDRSPRIAEFTLLAASALGGWPGGLLAILIFRHKSSKLSFLLKFFGAFLIFAFFCAGALRLTGRI